MDATHLIDMELTTTPIVEWAKSDIGIDSFRFETKQSLENAFYEFLAAHGFGKDRISDYVKELKVDPQLYNRMYIRLGGSGTHFKELCKFLDNRLSVARISRRGQEASYQRKAVRAYVVWLTAAK